MNRELPFAPSEALRAIVDNIEAGETAMYNLELRINHGPEGVLGEWRNPVSMQATIEIASLLSGRVQIRRKPPLTAAQRLGWSVGDVGRIEEDGRLVMLHDDDGSRMPFWEFVAVTGHVGVFRLDEVERLIPESQIAGRLPHVNLTKNEEND